MLKAAKSYALLIAILLSLGMGFGAWAGEKEGCAGIGPGGHDPLKEAARAVVGIWDPEMYRASIAEIYENIKGPIAIMAAGVVLEKWDNKVVVITADLPRSSLSLEFLEDRSWRDMPIERLLRERTAGIEGITHLGGGLFAITLNTNDIPLFEKIKPIAIGKMENGAVQDAFMVINYLGKAELGIWGSIEAGCFIDETGLVKSFAVPGTPVFNALGHLIGVYKKDGTMFPIATAMAREEILAKLHP